MSRVTSNLNKVCEIEDFRDADLAHFLRELFPQEAALAGRDFPAHAEDCEQWESAMAVRALLAQGRAASEAAILCIGPRAEDAAFYLTRHVRRVLVTDLYLDPGHHRMGGAAMLTLPQSLCPYPVDLSRLQARHMDGRVLDFPDASFAGIFCTSIGARGDLSAVATAAYEIGRVLEPGAVAAIGFDLLLGGPPLGTHHLESPPLFDEARLRRWIVEASGLEMTGGFNAEVTAATLATRRDRAVTENEIAHGERKLPHLVLASGGWVYGSAVVVLRKPTPWPAVDNSWARPTAALRAEVAGAAARAGAAAGAGTGEAIADRAPVPTEGGLGELRSRLERWEELRRLTALAPTAVESLPRRIWGFATRTLRRVRVLGLAAELESQLLHQLVDEVERSERQTAELAAAVAEVRIVTARVADLTAESQSLLDAIQALTARQHTLTARLGVVATRQDQGEQALLDHAMSLIAIAERLQPRAARSGLEGLPQVIAEPEVPDLPAGDLAPVFAALERALPRLVSCSSIQVSGGGEGAARWVAGAAAHFGSRLAPPGAGNTSGSRFPHDAWVHLDAGPLTERSIVLACAASELRRGGLVILLTASAAELKDPGTPRLRRHEDADLGDPVPGLRARVWERT